MNPADQEPEASISQTVDSSDKDSKTSASDRESPIGTTFAMLRNLLIATAVIALMGFLALILFTCSLFHPSEKHSLSAYPGLMARHHRNWAKHFPTEIPADATLKKLCYFPGVGQGGWYLQLRLLLPPERIRELYIESAQQRTKSFFGGNCDSHIRMADSMPTTNFYTADDYQGTGHPSFPADYEIMVFDPIMTASEKQRYRGRDYVFSHGVAISTQRHEIVYWAHAW